LAYQVSLSTLNGLASIFTPREFSGEQVLISETKKDILILK